jgi:DNA-binding response OmpR family regulator
MQATIPLSTIAGKGVCPRVCSSAIENVKVYQEDGDAQVSEGARQYAGRILVVEDDPDLLSVISRILERAGFLILRARDGEEGWRAIETSHFDLVITDNEMPRLDGMKMIRRLRAYSTEPPCLLISGSIDGQEQRLMRSICPGMVLAKPFSPLVLLETVMHLLLNGEASTA